MLLTSLPVAGGEADAFCLLCFSYGIVSPGRSNVNIFLRNICIFYPAHGTLRAYTVRKRRCSVWLRTIRTRIRIRTRTKIRIRAKTRTRSRASRPRNATDVRRADVWEDAGKSRRPFSWERRMPLGMGVRNCEASDSDHRLRNNRLQEMRYTPSGGALSPRPTGRHNVHPCA